MAAIGRGRGRGRATVASKSEVKPGNQAAVEDPVIEIMALIGELSFTKLNEDELEPIKVAVEKFATSSERLDKTAQVIYKECLADWRSSDRYVMLCKQLLHLQFDGIKFRDCMLRVLQKDYKEIRILRQDYPKKCLGCVSFLCQVFRSIRAPDNVPHKPLMVPVMDSIESLLDNKATDEEIECACTQLKDVGSLLSQYGDKQRLEKLRSLLRDKLLDVCGTRESRMLMIRILESFASDWTPCYKN